MRTEFHVRRRSQAGARQRTDRGERQGQYSTVPPASGDHRSREIRGRVGGRREGGARALRPRPDGERRSNRGFSEWRHRFQRGRGLHEPAQFSAREDVLDRLPGIDRVPALQRVALCTAGCQSVRYGPPRDPRPARRRGTAPGTDLVPGRAHLGRSVHHHLSRVQVRPRRRDRHPVRRGWRRALRRIQALPRRALSGDLPARARVHTDGTHHSARPRTSERPAQPGAEPDATRQGVSARGRACIRGAVSHLHAGVRRSRAYADASTNAGSVRRLHCHGVRDVADRRPAAATDGRGPSHAAPGRSTDADRQDEHGRVARMSRSAARSTARGACRADAGIPEGTGGRNQAHPEACAKGRAARRHPQS